MLMYTCWLKLLTTSSYIEQNYKDETFFMFLLAPEFWDSFWELLFPVLGAKISTQNFLVPSKMLSSSINSTSSRSRTSQRSSSSKTVIIITQKDGN